MTVDMDFLKHEGMKLGVDCEILTKKSRSKSNRMKHCIHCFNAQLLNNASVWEERNLQSSILCSEKCSSNVKRLAVC